MDSITLFKQAAQQLQKEEVYARYMAARKANDEDEELQDRIGEFNLLRIDLNQAMSAEPQDEAKTNELNQKMSDLYTEIMNTASMVGYNEAKQGLDKRISYINAILNAACNGEDPMAVEEPSGCTGSCSSCGGCH